MLHDLRRNGFILHRPIRPLHDRAPIQPAVNDDATEPLQLAPRPFALTLGHARADDKTLLRIQRIDIRTRVAEALSDVDKAASERSQQIVRSDMPEPLWVDGDAARLRQALANLLDNAVKLTEPGGRIHVGAWRDGHHILVRVTDTGRGLHPDEMTRMFELLSRARPREGHGLGIRLDVAWESVALHKGRIDVRSNGPSCGREFTVTLPSADYKD